MKGTVVMKRYWYKRILIMVLVFAVSVGGGYYLIQYKQETLNKEVSVNTSGTNGNSRRNACWHLSGNGGRTGVGDG